MKQKNGNRKMGGGEIMYGKWLEATAMRPAIWLGGSRVNRVRPYFVLMRSGDRKRTTRRKFCVFSCVTLFLCLAPCQVYFHVSACDGDESPSVGKLLWNTPAKGCRGLGVLYR
ncbi:unnamed protein product, partial [Ectocarpus sp. 12 AP-2014]